MVRGRRGKREITMADYIERQALLKAYLDLALAKSKAAKARKGAATFQGDLFPMVELTEKEWVGLINAAPATDVVEVVRCKDCKKTDEGELAGRKFLFCTYPFAMKGGCRITDPNHFCSYGVRKN